MSVFEQGVIRPRKEQLMGSFDVEVWDGARWMSGNDHLNYIVGDQSFESTAVGRRRHTVSSSMYDGEWEVHSVTTMVTETLVINVLGHDQVVVSENLIALQDAFTQDRYNLRVRRDEVMETWRCFPAEYTINRGRIQSHNIRAQVSLQVPRFPKVSHEVVP